MSTEWWQTLFGEDYPEIFDLADEEAADQIDFLITHLVLKPEDTILDLCCGHGRHVLRLRDRGYRTIGIDFSPQQLRRARERAEEEQSECLLVRGDVRALPLRASSCDVVICMFTSFGYFDDEQNERVVQHVARILREGGRFLLDVPNPTKTWRWIRPQRWEEDVAGGRVLLEEFARDPVNGRIESRKILYNHGVRREYRFSFREYTCAELRAMIERQGMRITGIWGSFDGRRLTDNSARMILRARKGAT